MKKQFLALSLTVAALGAVPFSLLADDAVPPKPPGGSNAPAAPSSATPAPGNPGGGGPGRFSPEERLKRMTEALNLTQEQQDKIKAIMEKTGPQLRELISKGRDNLTEDDKTKIRELLKSQTEDIAAVLTQEQKDKFKELMERRRNGGGAGGGNGAGTPAK
jgi:Spy/CpxP family protein refolding chaperone